MFKRTGPQVNRRKLGLPDEWRTVEEWLDDSRDIAATEEPNSPEVILKNPEIKSLPSYVVPPPAEFWDTFPKNYPKNLNAIVDTERLERLIKVAKANGLGLKNL